MWDVNYRTLDISRKEESLRNDVDILDNILNVSICIQGEWLWCDLLSDEIIIDKGNMRSVIWGMN